VRAGLENTHVPEKENGRQPLELRKRLLSGSRGVESGTGAPRCPWPQDRTTYFAAMASSITGIQVETSFDKGIHKVHVVDDHDHDGDGAARVPDQTA